MNNNNPRIPARWAIATLLIVAASLLVRVTLLDDQWLRLMLAGGDGLGLVAKERRARLDEQAPPEPAPTVDSESQ